MNTRVAAIDLGTNSFLCLIAEVSGRPPTASIKTIFDTYKIVRLGEKVHQSRRFLPEALSRAEKCLDEFAAVIKRHKVDKVIATATSAARDAENGNELMKLGAAREIPIHIIGGAREAELSFEGAISAVKDNYKKNILVVDVGGGSTELIFRKPGENLKAQSFDVGCVRLTEMFLKNDPISPSEFENMSKYAAGIMAAYGQVAPELVIAVAGTPTTLACVAQEIDFDEKKVEGFTLTRKKINELCKNLGAMPLTKRKNVKGLEPLRADVIIAGGALLNAALDLAMKDEMRVSTRGLRYGVALHHASF